MADLLSHLLIAYGLLTVASWRLDWLARRWILVGVGGAAVPDLVKVDLLLDEDVVARSVGLPFEWEPLTTVGGIAVIAGLITLAFARRHWARAYILVLAGGFSSLLFDGLRVFADGRAGAWLYPFTNWRPPPPRLYVSSDPRVLVVAVAVATVVTVVDRRLAL